MTEMRIPSVKIIRRILIGVIGVVALAALINYMVIALRRPRDDGNRPPMISADFRRAAEGVESFIWKGSVRRFTVRALRLKETVNDRNFLEGIEASDFNSDGSVRNSIYSDRAVYDPGRKTLDFDGDVRVFLGDDVELRAAELHYDLNTEIGVIPANMEFFSSNVSGRARDVRFFRDENLLELGGEVDFSLASENTGASGGEAKGVIRAVATRGMCLLSENRILFSSGVRIETPDTGTLAADTVDMELDQGRNKITTMTASGNAAYETQSREGARSISGGQMIFTAGTTGALEKALISERAILLVKSESEEQSLSAGEIELFLDSTNGAIREIRGASGVDFRARRGAGETLASGDAIYAAFANAGGRLLNVRAWGRSRFVLTGNGRAVNELLAETIEARFQNESDSDNVEYLTANGAVNWVFAASDSGGTEAGRTLFASKLEIHCAGNYPVSGEASGTVALEETAAPGMIRQLKAERILFDFFPNSDQVKSLTAEDNVRIGYERAASSFGKSGESGKSGVERYQTSSNRLDAFFVYSNGTGLLARVAQSGNFRFDSDGRSASADRGEYDADSKKLTLTGSPEILDGIGRVYGNRVEYDLEADELLARGRVRAVLDARQNKGALFQAGGDSAPVVVTAEELRYRAAEESFQFSGGVVALTESQQLSAREIIIDGGGGMTARGDIIHRIQDANSGGGKTAAIIESGQMEYLRGEGVVRYFDKVEMKSKERALSADTLYGTLDYDGKSFRRVMAVGNVLVRYDGRVCRGDAAEWNPAAPGFIVTGNPVIIDDPAQGRSMAGRLTYFQGEDRITLEP